MDVFIVVMTRSWPSRLDLVAHRLRPQPAWLNAVRIWKASAKKPTWKGRRSGPTGLNTKKLSNMYK